MRWTAGARQSVGARGWLPAPTANRLIPAVEAVIETSMRIQIQFRIVADDGSVISEDEILQLDKGDDRLEAIGLSLGEAKALLAGIQERMVTAQAASFAARHRDCPACGRRRRSKGPSPIVFRTAFGTVRLASPRFHRNPPPRAAL